MRIAVTSESNIGLASPTSHHFGRCPYYVFVDVEDNEIKSVHAIPNPYANGHQPGMVPQFIHQQEANVILSGGMGYRAIGFFQQLDIQVATGARGTVGETVQLFLDGSLKEAAPCSDSVAHQQGGHQGGNHQHGHH